MTRGPYQGTWEPNRRPTVVTAPDTLVYINGEMDVLGCSACKRRFDFNKYITSVQVDLSVESVPGSASVSMSIPRHAIDDFYFDGEPVLTPMMEIEIFAKGYYLVEGLPQYYPIFWGLITDVSDNYSSGAHTVSVSCADILKWWDLCKMNINPAFTGPPGQMGSSIFGNVFFGTNPYDVIWSLAQSSFGDVIVGTGSLVSLYQEQNQKPTFSNALKDIMLYWEQRFQRIRSNLLLYGVNGVAVRGDTLYETYRKSGSVGQRQARFASTAVSNANGGALSGQMVFDPTSNNVVAFRTQFNQAGEVNFWQSEYETKLQLAQSAKEVLGFEFYMDVTGDIVFKPPFFNLDIMSNKPLSWIQDIDIIDWDFGDSEGPVITQIQMAGNFGGTIDYGLPEECTPYTSVTDYHLLRKYGWRSETYNSEFMASPMLMFYHGMDILDRKNAARFTGSVTIPFRPELRIGFPVYVEPKDAIWYVSGISHSIQFGGRAQTTLTLTAKRGKFLAPKGISKLVHTGFLYGSPPTPGKTSGKKPGEKNNSSTKQSTKSTGVGIDSSYFPYPSKMLSQSGTFNLTLGGAASMPATTEPKPTEDNPYAPLILRHPKTGKIVGYPNVVMMYTRPFKSTDLDSAKKAAGQKPKGTNKQMSAAEQKKKTLEVAAQADKVVQGALAGPLDRLREEHATNRYQYGLNSAGVYVYAHDTKKVIGEILLLPAQNVTVKDKPPGEGFYLNNKQSGMIRPVSDERGYEVIGHFRYGRGISLKDGRFMVNPQEANPTTPVSVDVQVALGGSLYETLEAQSQGITTKTSIARNPADAIATLTPDDLQTAGIINPDTGKPEFIAQAPNFADSGATLGSAEKKGYFGSVEASQLSKALTIAEMTVTHGSFTSNPNCACVLGRSDLAFMSFGTSFTNINPAQPAPNLFETPSAESPVVGGAEVNTFGATVSKVHEFLINLYEALDEPHKAIESQLRGGTLLIEGEIPTGAEPVPTQTSSLSPPFSAIGRAGLGDPNATVGDVKGAVQNIEKAWHSFGENMKNNTKKAALNAKLAQQQSDLNNLLKARDEQNAAMNASVSLGGNPQKNLASLDKQIAKLKQDIENTKAELTQLS